MFTKCLCSEYETCAACLPSVNDVLAAEDARLEETATAINKIAEECRATAVSKGWFENALNHFRDLCHNASVDKGWWSTPLNVLMDDEITIIEPDLAGELLVTQKASKLALIHSEVSECLEGLRNDLDSDKLEGRKMEEEELADIIIRIMDYCGAYNIDIGKVCIEKFNYNQGRAHRHGGKKL